MELVRQRQGRADCVIACIANALSLTYEQSEELLGIKCEDLPKGGHDLHHTIHRLLRRGWAAVPLLVFEDKDDAHLWPTEADIKAQLPGRKAIIGYRDAEAGDHSLYWDGEILHDCSTPAPSRPPNLAELKLNNALVLFPVPVVD